jgi:hypothetical protein
MVRSGDVESGPPSQDCTIGFNAVHAASGDTSFVTASHCTDKDNRPWGNDNFPWHAFQTTWTASHKIAEEADDPSPSSCFGGNFRCRESDAVRFKYDSDVLDSVALGVIARTEYAEFGLGEDGSTVIDSVEPYFEIVYEESYPSAGDTIHKMGRVTGWTTGVVTGTCTTIYVDGNDYLTCQYVSNNLQTFNGDSGSPVFREWPPGDERATLLGMFIGIFDTLQVLSPMGGIEADLGVLGTIPQDLTATINGPSEVPPSPILWCTWKAQASGGSGAGTRTFSWEIDGEEVETGLVLELSEYEMPEDDFDLELIVTDATDSDSDGLWVELDESAECDIE